MSDDYNPDDELFEGVPRDHVDLPNQVNLETNSTIDDRLRRYELPCNYCRPHKGENADTKKRGKQERKYKNKRRK